MICFFYTLAMAVDPAKIDRETFAAGVKEMMAQLGTSPDQKKMFAIPQAGNHVLASPIQSKDIITVEKQTVVFLKETLHLQTIQH